MHGSKLLLKNITRSYGDIKAVRDFHLELSEKSFMCACRSIRVWENDIASACPRISDSGFQEKIYIDDQLVNQKTPAQRNISMVFQEAALFPHMSVF